MTYVAQLYKVFSSLDRVETAGRRVGKFVNFAKSLNEMIEEYERRTKALNAAVNGKASELGSYNLGNDYHSAKSAIQNFRNYKKTQKREWIAESAELVTLYGNIQAKEKSMNRPPYVPPQGLAPADVDTNFGALHQSEHTLNHSLNQNLRNILDGLRKAFATPANSFYSQLQTLREALASDVAGDLESQLNFFKGKQSAVQGLANELPSIKSAEDKCNDANIDDNEFTDYSYDDLEFEHSQLQKNYSKKVSFIEAQIALAAETRNITPEQLQEFKETFNHFDSQKSGHLSKLDFKACLSGLGVVELDFEGGNAVFEALFKRVSNGGETVSFEQFADYMISITVDTVSPQQLRDSFDIIAGGKDHITVNDLKVAQLSAQQIEFLTSTLPKHGSIPDAYDYKTWLNSQV